MEKGYVISTDKTKLNYDVIHQFLSNCYWAQGRTFSQVTQSIEHSHCFGVYANDAQIGFARVITDYVTFAYLADVFVLPNYQGQGIGKQLLAFIVSTAELSQVNKWLLLTRDAHHLYDSVGFIANPNPERVMVRVV